MINVCANCGEYRADKLIDDEGPFAICPICSHKHRFLRLPLFAIGGPSGSGKSTIGRFLTARKSEIIVLEGDILWNASFDNSDDNYRDFFDLWLRMAKNISQSGHPVAILAAGIALPDNVESCVERRYFSIVHYCALTCDDEILEERLGNRPSWRGSSDPAFIERNLAFNNWLRENAAASEPTIELVDTSNRSPESTAQTVLDWMSARR